MFTIHKAIHLVSALSSVIGVTAHSAVFPGAVIGRFNNKREVLFIKLRMICIFFKMPFCPCPLGCSHFLSPDDGHDCCLLCRGIEHTEDSFMGGSCPYYESIIMAMLQWRLSFLRKGRDPSVTIHFVSSAQHRVMFVSVLGDLRITVGANPPGQPPWTSHSSCSICPMQLPDDSAGPSHGSPSISFGAPQRIRF